MKSSAFVDSVKLIHDQMLKLYNYRPQNMNQCPLKVDKEDTVLVLSLIHI